MPRPRPTLHLLIQRTYIQCSTKSRLCAGLGDRWLPTTEWRRWLPVTVSVRLEKMGHGSLVFNQVLFVWQPPFRLRSCSRRIFPVRGWDTHRSTCRSNLGRPIPSDPSPDVNDPLGGQEEEGGWGEESGPALAGSSSRRHVGPQRPARHLIVRSARHRKGVEAIPVIWGDRTLIRVQGVATCTLA